MRIGPSIPPLLKETVALTLRSPQVTRECLCDLRSCTISRAFRRPSRMPFRVDQTEREYCHAPRGGRS